MPLIPSPRHTAADLEAWAVREQRIRRYLAGNRGRLDRLEARAVATIRSFDGDWCAVSWGKDSTVVADLCRRTAPRLPLCWVVTTPGESPECTQVRDIFLRGSEVYEEFEDCPTVEGGFLRVNDAEAWPPEARFGPRYVYGLRADESSARKLRARAFGESSRNTCAPITWWTGLDVFAYLVRYDLPIHPAYAMSRGGLLDFDRLRVAPIGSEEGTGHGRREWERFYYPEMIAALEARS